MKWSLNAGRTPRLTLRTGAPSLDSSVPRQISQLDRRLHGESFQIPWRALLLIFGVSLIVRVICFTGLVGSDDIFYSAYAQQIVEGTYQLEHHHMAIRYGVILPVAAIYKVFGINEWSTVALPLLASSLAPVLAALVGFQLSGTIASWVAGLLLASFPVTVQADAQNVGGAGPE